jgi:putative sigma-54 modulation protein
MMQLHFVGKNIEVTDALKNITIEKFQALEKRHSHITNVHVVFVIENLTQIVEATIHVNGTEIHATARSEDMYKSIDLLVDKLVGQMTKLKEKVIDSHRQSS